MKYIKREHKDLCLITSYLIYALVRPIKDVLIK